MLSDEEKEEYEELKSLLYTGTISQYGKRKLIEIIEKQSKEIEELKDTRSIFNMGRRSYKNEIEDKIKAKIEEIDKVLNEDIYVIDGNYDDRYYRYLQDKHILQSLLEKE